MEKENTDDYEFQNTNVKGELKMKKNKTIKIKFTTAIILIEIVFLISMITIYYIYNVADNKIKSKEYKTEIKNTNITGSVSQKNNTENKKIELDWEEYPKNDKWVDEAIGDNIKKDSTAFKLAKKTLYSLNSNKIKKFNERYYNIFGIGDSTKIIDWTSNYARYCYPDNEKNDLSAKYTKKIILKNF